MPFLLIDYVNLDIATIEGTPGGDTRIVGGKPLCFNYVSSHFRAVEALTDGKSQDYAKIQDSQVDGLVVDGTVVIDESGCLEGFGWLGCKVWDGDGEFIGEIGGRCSKPAGWQTDHPGKGGCKFHRGRAVGKIKHGRYSNKLRRQLQDKIQTYMNSPDFLDLRRELATQRAILEYMAEEMMFQDGGELSLSTANGLLRNADYVGRMAERIINMEAKTTITASQVLYLQAVVTDVISKYLPDPVMREKAAKELAKRFGTGSVDTSQLLIQASTMSGNVTR